MKKAYLLLQDGTLFEGEALGAEGVSIGEVVFNTGMTGYQEALTDPSFYGQTVTMTYPLVGNYGLNGDDEESEHPWLRGFIVRESAEHPSNWRCSVSLDAYLKKHNVVGLGGIDTRRLTRILRESGVMNGAIFPEDAGIDQSKLMEQIRAYKVTDAVKAVSGSKVETFEPKGEPELHVALWDFGAKRGVLRSLLKRNCRVTVLPYSTTAKEILAGGYDGLLLSNGPGDPEDNPEIIGELGALTGSGMNIFGICLGHQLLALAAGARTCKLKYGHRGGNHPSTDLARGRTYITSQNHGYAVVPDSVPEEVCEISHVNLNDGTVEGIRYKQLPVCSVQFHPEGSPGPQDSAYLFDEFVARMKANRGCGVCR